jgi:hypothetical protein
MKRLAAMKKKLLLLTAALCLSLAASSAQAIYYPPCDTYCPTVAPASVCMCPKWTDRPYRIVTCSSWNSVGSCWYE